MTDFTHKPSVLYSDNDMALAPFIVTFLEQKGFHCVWECDGEAAWRTFQKMNFDMVVASVNIPKLDGYSMAIEIRKSSDVPIIFLSEKVRDEENLQGFLVGGDDCISKPVNVEILYWKIYTHLKRLFVLRNNQNPALVMGQTSFYYQSKTLVVGEHTINVTTKEAELLLLLFKNANNVVYRETALQHIWNDESYTYARSMDVYITKIRKYLQTDKSLSIQNYRGVGYKLASSRMSKDEIFSNF
ncbi:transcriptional regulatory protein RprY [Bacteroidia bacterium]|nr:transcriptional regulatory protein RprY [Bacteroidia bacterium]